MSTFSLSVTVSTPAGSEEPTYELEAPDSGTTVMSVAPGEKGVVLSEATSPIMDGSVVTGMVRDTATATLVVRVFGTPSEVFTLMDTIEGLFQQLAYTVVVSIGESEETWLCGPANTARGQSGVLDAPGLAAGWQDLVIDIPRQP